MIARLIRHVPDHRQIVADEQIGQPKFLLQTHHQVENLCLHGNIERRCRLVAHQKIGLRRKRARNGNALTLPTGKFVRKAADISAGEADDFKQVTDARQALAVRRAQFQFPDRFGDNIAHTPAWIEAGIRILKNHLNARQACGAIVALDLTKLQRSLSGILQARRPCAQVLTCRNRIRRRLKMSCRAARSG